MIGTVVAGIAAVVAIVISLRSYSLSVSTYDLQVADRNERLANDKRKVSDRITWWRENYARETETTRYFEPLLVIQNSSSEPVTVYVLADYFHDGQWKKRWASKGVMPPCTIMRDYPLESVGVLARREYRESFNKATYTLYFIDSAGNGWSRDAMGRLTSTSADHIRNVLFKQVSPTVPAQAPTAYATPVSCS
ncbi:hypothetical protein [Nonomuraea sp. NPDC049758]|uniref:hypothetical protein n=1 Tax=Nonomuraea sp. NPDC049758 TaxID=3154360 RepID=UPI003413B665